jgi:hypothetical protein
MPVAGIDAHATYVVVAIVSKTGELVEKATRMANREGSKLLELLERVRPVEAAVERGPAWAWLCDLLGGHGHGFVLEHAKELRATAESNYKRDEIDAELLARMRLAGLIPEVYAKGIEAREQAALVRHRARPGPPACVAAARSGAAPSRAHALGPDPRADEDDPPARPADRTHGYGDSGRGPASHDPGHRSLPGPANRHGGDPDRAFPSPPASGELRRPRAPFRKLGPPARAPRAHPGRSEPLAEGRLRPGRGQPHAPRYNEQKQRLGWQTARIAAARKLARATHGMLRTGEVWRNENGSGERSELQGAHVAETIPVS